MPVNLLPTCVAFLFKHRQVARVLNVIRGRPYEEALIMLEYMPYRACEPILATLLSAAANAAHNNGADKLRLYVSEAFATPGPVLKRAFPRARGRSDVLRKPSFHMTIRVREMDEAFARRQRLKSKGARRREGMRRAAARREGR